MTNRLALAVLSLTLACPLGGGFVQLQVHANFTQQDPRIIARGQDEEKLPAGALARMGGMQFRHGDRIFFVAYLPDGKELITGSDDGTLRLWNATTGREVRKFARNPRVRVPASGGDRLQQRGERLQSLSLAALSPDGKVLAAAAYESYCWDVASGKELSRQLGPSMYRYAIGFADGGKTIILSNLGGHSIAWNAASGQGAWHVGQPPQQSEPRYTSGGGPAISGNGKLIARADLDMANRTQLIKVRDLSVGKDLPDLNSKFMLVAMRFSPDAKMLAWADSDGEVQFWEVTAGKALDPLGCKDRKRVVSLAFSPDGKMLALGRDDGAVEVWDVPGRKRLRHLLGACLPPRFFYQPSLPQRADLAFSPNGKTLAVGFARSSLHLVDISSGKEVSTTGGGHHVPVRGLGVAPAGKVLITHAPGDAVRLWDMSSGKELRRVSAVVLSSLATMTADGKALAATDPEGNVVVYEGATGNVVRTMEGRPKNPLSDLTFSDDGKSLAAREYFTREVWVWDVATGKARATLRGAQNEPRPNVRAFNQNQRVATSELVFSPDGKYLVGSTGGDQLGLWDVGTGEKLREFALAEKQFVNGFTFSADGQTLSVPAADGTLVLYETATGLRRGQLDKIDLYPLGRDPRYRLAFSPDGRFLAASPQSPDIRVFDVLTGKEVGDLNGHEGGVVSLRFSPDGKRLFSGSLDGTALTWDMAVFAREARPQIVKLDADASRRLWEDLASADAEAAFRSVRKLWASPTNAVELLSGRLKPVPAVDAERIRKSLADLDANSFSVRQKATADLEDVGDLAVPAMREALAKGVAPEARQRLEQVLRKLTLRSPEGELIRNLRAVEVLEHIGTPEARQVLQTLAGGAEGARLTVAAREALRRGQRNGITP
jgi:WD40 repeat protein